MRKQIIVSGHRGYIGSNFCKILKKKKIKFLKYNFNNKKKNWSNFTHFFHFDFDIKIKNSSMRKNKERMLKILSLCSGNNIKLIFPSTCTYKYNKFNKRTSEQIHPINNYSKSKIQCEKNILLYQKKFDLNFFIFRIFNVYGNTINNKSVIASLIKKLRKHKATKLVYSENVRDFIHIDDILTLFVKSLNINTSGIYELGSEETVSIKNLALMIKEIYSYKSKIIFTKPYKSVSNNFSKSNIKKTKSTFSWKPIITLKEGLKKNSNFK